MIDEIVAAYGHVAGLAKQAGFELLMIHGGHGWLINQFLSPLFNHRIDEYGGSLENRCRLAVEVLKSVREAVGPFFPIEFRMSGAEFVKNGYDLDEGVRIAQMIEPYVDLIHVSAGTYQKTFGITHPSMFTDHGRNVFLAAEIKKHVSKPVATIGGLNDPVQMEEIIASGKADVIYMARALLADPFLPSKVMANEVEQEQQQEVNVAQFIALVKRYTEVDELTPATLNEFISRIVVYAPDRSSGKRTQRIDIQYNFVGEIPDILAKLKTA